MKKLAVVGSGISGLAAAWLLSRNHHVTLFEADARLGGHSHTVDVTLDGITAPIDTGFLVCNDRTYPNLMSMFRHLDVSLHPSEMTLSVQTQQDGIEWSGSNLATLFGQRSNLLRPSHWRMVADILRFNRQAKTSMQDDSLSEISMGEFMRAHDYSDVFRDRYLLPMAAAIWSCPTRQMLEFPAATFIRFFHNHGLLQISDRPQWLTVIGGSRNYVARLGAGISEVRRAYPVEKIMRLEHGVTVHAAGHQEHFDAAILACHADQTLALLEDADHNERRILQSIPYQSNRAILHTDSSVLPRRRSLWSAWNFHGQSASPDDTPVSVTYLINRLQPLPFKQPVMVTLNPNQPIAADKVIRSFDYAHPVFDTNAIAAQQSLASIQGMRNTWFCGAWCGYGFHEDGLKSGIAVAKSLGATIPWEAEN